MHGLFGHLDVDPGVLRQLQAQARPALEASGPSVFRNLEIKALSPASAGRGELVGATAPRPSRRGWPAGGG